MTDAPGSKQKRAIELSPSWVDRLQDQLERLRLPVWLTYLACALALLTLELSVKWRDLGSFLPVHVSWAISGVCTLAFIHYLDASARVALPAFRPAMDTDDDGFERLLGQLTTMPARPAAAASLLGVVVGALALLANRKDMGVLKLFTSPLSDALEYPLYFLTWAVLGALAYHTVHQLRLVTSIHTSYTRIDIFRIGTTYVLSGLAARTAIGWVILNYGWIVVVPHYLEHPTALLIVAGMGAFSVTTFIWPLWGIHRLLEEEKKRLQSRTAQHIRDLILEMDRAVGAGEMDRIDPVGKSLKNLSDVQSALEKLPTWPWQTNTVRWLSTAILLPLLIFLGQRLVERFLLPR